ncbi:MAG TPA: histidine--tRNA ligase [Candidatus Acidoferrum sp.]|nr:histidine--tRNA ligase [Candidatus Acidoferrum sp.]
MKLDTTPPRGMRDVLPDEVDLRDRTLATILDVYRRRGFVRIETPAVESLALLTGGEGGENEKLIFKILKRGERLAAARDTEELSDLGLRFDLTVPLARYYAHNHARLPQPLKAIQIGPVWRAERPQHGRFRQFTQCDIDILGVRSEVAEIELILATADALLAIGLDGLTVRVNDRRMLASVARHCGFEEARFDSVFIALDKLDKIEASGVAEELVEAGHARPAVSALMSLLETSAGTESTPERLAQRLGDGADPSAARALTRIIDSVTQVAGDRFRVTFDPTLVRGMSYYTGPIFEIRYRDAASSIAGGGRYDRMIGKLLGRDVPATGFSIGFERVINILTERGGAGAHRHGKTAIVFDEDTTHLGAVLAMARDLWDDGGVVTLELKAKRFGKQLQDLESRGFGRVVVFDAEGQARDADLAPRPEPERPA